MVAITGCTTAQCLPNPNYKILVITTPATADSNNTIDVSDAAVTGGDVIKTLYGVLGVFDLTQGDSVTGTWSSTTITIDAAGGTTDHTYMVIVMGV